MMKQEIKIFDAEGNLIGTAKEIVLSKHTTHTSDTDKIVVLLEGIEFDPDALSEDYGNCLLEQDLEYSLHFRIEAYNLDFPEEGPPSRELFCRHDLSACSLYGYLGSLSLRRRKICYDTIQFYAIVKAEAPMRPYPYLNYQTGDSLYTITTTSSSTTGGGFYIYYDNSSGNWTIE